MSKIKQILGNKVTIKMPQTTRFTVLTLVLAALVIGLIAALGLHLDRITQEEIVTRFSQRQLLLIEQTAAGIQAIFNEARRDLLHLKGAPGPARLADALAVENEEEIAAWRDACKQGFSSYLRSQPNYTQIRYIDAGGQEIVGMDRDGETVRAIPQDQLRLQAERDFFVATMQLDAGEIYVSPPGPALSHGGVGAGRLTIRLATPVFDSRGRRAGILVINLLGDEIRTHIARLSAEEGADAWMLDETGVDIINVTHPEREGGNAYEYCQQIGDETLIALTEDMLAGGRGAGIYLWPEEMGGPPKIKRLLAYAPVYPATGHLWSVGISVTYDSVLAAHRQTHWMLLFLGGNITVIILSAAVLLIHAGYKRAAAEGRAHRSEELESLRKISLAITAQLELDELLQNVVEQGRRLLGVRAGGLYLVDETRGDLELVVSHGFTRDYTGARLAPGEGLGGKVLQRSEPLVVDDYSHWEGRSPGWEAEPITANLGVPLKHGGQVIGVLGFAEIGRARSFDESDAWLATLFSNQAAIAIENARLYEQAQQEIAERKRAEEALRWERDLAGALEEAAAALTATLDFEQVLDRILEQVSRVVPGDATNIMLIEGDQAHIVRWRGHERFGAEEFVSTATFHIPEIQTLRQMRETGEPMVVPDTAAYPGWVHVPVQEWLRSYAAAPIVVRDEVIGFLNVDSATPGFFTQAHVEALRAFAGHAAVAIENARVYEDARTHAEELAVLNELGQALTSRLSVEQVMDEAYRGASRLMDTTNFYIVLYDPDEDEITFALDVIDGEVQKPSITHPAGKGLAEYIIRSRTPLLIEDHLPERLKELEIDLLGRPALSWVGAPLVVGDRVLGMMAAVQSETASSAYGEHDRNLLLSVASQTAIALQNAYLFEETQRRVAQLALLNDVGGKIAAVLELDSVLERAARLVQENFGYHHVAIFTVDHEQGEVVMRTRAGEFAHLFPPNHRLKLGQGMVGWVGRHGETLLANDVDAEPRYVNLYPDLVPTRAELSVSIRVGEEIVGVIDVQSPQLNGFDESDVMVIETLANQVAMAIENARLYEAIRQELAERKRAEEALRELNATLETQVAERTAELQAQYAWLDAILRSTTDGIVVTNEIGSIAQANPVAQAWLTRTLSPEEAGRLREAIRSVARQACAEETRLRPEAQSEGFSRKNPVSLLELTGLDLELSAAPVVEEEGAEKPTAAVVAIHDVSHLKALDRVKTHFVTNVSHELRTPITTIKLYIHLMQRQPEKWERYLDTLAHEADHQARLVEDILQISRIDAGRLEMEPCPTPLNELTKAAVANHRVLAQEQGLALEYHSAPPRFGGAGGGGPVSLVDPERMRQVLDNLIGNAIRYTPEGGTVVVSTGIEEAEGRTWATVTVADTGMGIPAEELPHVFERFFRGVKPREMQLTGTGLGLSIVKEIVELHGGRVAVESPSTGLRAGTEDVGSTFTVWLPLAE